MGKPELLGRDRQSSGGAEVMQLLERGADSCGAATSKVSSCNACVWPNLKDRGINHPTVRCRARGNLVSQIGTALRCTNFTILETGVLESRIRSGKRLDGARGVCYPSNPFSVANPVPMSSPQAPKSNSPLPGDDRPVVAASTDLPQVSFEERVQLFWFENKKTILLTCALVFVILVAKEGVLYYLDQRERAIGAAFAAAETSPEKLRAFANENSGHKLAGLAWLSIGDDAFKAAKYADAVSAYEKAEPLVAGTAFAGRALIGQAFSIGLGGDKTKAEAAFKKVVADAKQPAAIRTEARYHLALLAVEAGRIDDARKALEEVLQNDESGAWSQRAMSLQSSLPSEPVVAAVTPTAEPATEIKLNLPGKK